MPRKPKEQENIAGYFRPIFQENPELLKSRSNEELLKRWLADHPGEREVPARVKQGLANLKSVLRSKRRRRRRVEEVNAAANGVAPALRKRALGSLEQLEVQIDDCIMFARSHDREGLDEVINHLRRARNAVVWKLGQ